MILTIPTIGTHKIIVPEPKDADTQLLFADGKSLADTTINDNLVQGIIRGTSKIFILVPDHISQFRDNGKGGSTIMGEFYVGLLEPLLEQIRDELFPELKPQANRDRIFEVGKDIGSAKDIVKDIFHIAWVTYDALEEFIRDKIKVGLLHDGGTYTLAEYDEKRHMKETGLLEDDNQKLFYFSYKYYAGLDGMFSANLECRTSFTEGLKSGNGKVGFAADALKSIPNS